METIVLTRVRTLNTHMKMHEQPIKCDYCDRRYSNAAGKYYHTHTYHLAGGAPCTVHCTICGKQYGSEAALKQHMKYHTTTLKCSKCDLVFNHPNKRRNHELTHNEDRGYECVVCKKVLQTIESYDVHLKKHSQERSYPCTLCPKKFNTSFNLILHLKVHAKNYNYRPAKSWVEHYTILSRDPMQYKCNHCDRYSTDKHFNNNNFTENDAQQQRLLLANMGSICFFPKCVPKTRDFVVFPFSRTREFENWWIKSGWVNAIPLERLPSKILICEEHFEKDLINRRYKVPRLALGALPTRNVTCPVRKSNPQREGTEQNNSSATGLYRDSYCRLCGQAQSTPLSDDLDLLLKLDEMFQNQLRLSSTATLPAGVCSSCKETANVMQEFWKKCIEAQETLQEIFKKASTAKPVANDSRPRRSETNKPNQTKPDERLFSNKETLPAEREEIVVDTATSSQVMEEHFANQYEFESYGEELPASTADESDEIIELTGPEKQLISDEFSIEYDGESSSQESANFSASYREENQNAAKHEGSSSTEMHICEVCGNSFKTLPGLKAHLLVHSGRRDHQCNICGHEFKQKRHLVEHIESKHERKTFPCKICGMPYSWKKGLQRHMNTHKGTALKHVCKVCGKAFPVPHKLKLHMMLHTGDRIHCEFCGKGYRFNYMLTQHKIRVHNMVIEGVKLYSTPKQKKLTERKKIATMNEEQLNAYV
uniref:Uncharacterized protein n=1 Tax=Anopheles epiroticus TaxID=199890 RepID=A0A182PNK7_9DIPT